MRRDCKLRIGNCKLQIDDGRRRAVPSPFNGLFTICNLQFVISPIVIANAAPPLVKAKAMLALLGIVIVGIGLLMMAVLGGGIVRRLARHRAGVSKPLDDPWYKRRLEEKLPDEPSDGNENHA